MIVLKPSMSPFVLCAETYFPAGYCRMLYPRKLNPAILSSLFSAIRVCAILVLEVFNSKPMSLEVTH